MHSFIVIGAGVVGLSAAFQLSRRQPETRVIVLEQFQGLHQRGSSHGVTRVTRSTYQSAAYTELAREAHARDWPELETVAGTPLWTRCGGFFAGEEPGPWSDFVLAMQGHDEVSQLDWEAAASRFPQFRVRKSSAVLWDRTAGVIYASRVLEELRRACTERSVQFQEMTVVDHLVLESGRRPAVFASNQIIEADGIIVAAGPWSDRLVPRLRPFFCPVRQTIAYFDPRPHNVGAGDAYGPSRLPAWIHVGREADDFFYGTPALEDGLIKVGRHRTHGPAADPDQPGIPDPNEVAGILAFAAEHFTFETGPPVRTETCLYSMTPNEDFVVDLHPEHPRVAVCAGLSGHGFKFAPLLGRVLADLATEGTTTAPSFERHRDRFRFR